MNDSDKATQVLTEIWRICLEHLGTIDSNPDDQLSRIIALLDPWPLEEEPSC